MLESQSSVVLRWHFNQNSAQLYGCTQFGAYKDKRPRHVTIVESQKKSLESLCNYATQHIREPVCLQTQMAPANETLTKISLLVTTGAKRELGYTRTAICIMREIS